MDSMRRGGKEGIKVMPRFGHKEDTELRDRMLSSGPA